MQEKAEMELRKLKDEYRLELSEVKNKWASQEDKTKVLLYS